MTAVFSVLGLVVGIVLGLFFPMYIPPAYTTYVAVALLAALDSLLGALHAQAKLFWQFAQFRPLFGCGSGIWHANFSKYRGFAQNFIKLEFKKEER